MKRRISAEIECGDLYCRPCVLVDSRLAECDQTTHKCLLFNRLLAIERNGPFVNIHRCEECLRGAQIAEDLDGAAIMAAIHTPGAMEPLNQDVKFITYAEIAEIDEPSKKAKKK